ncbi:MAG: hypothetical protein RSC93_12500 [Erysipelotrichaceae bacterium]
MKKIIGCLIVLIFIVGCSADSKYSLKNESIVCSVHACTIDQNKAAKDVKLLDVKANLLLEGQPLTKEQKQYIQVISNVDFDQAGEYKITFKVEKRTITKPLIVKIVE